jgi:purine catabolism regulator
LYPTDNLTHSHGKKVQEEVSHLAEWIKSSLQQEFNRSFSTGFGMFQPGVDGIAVGYRDAEMALQLGRTFHEKNFCCHFNDLRVYRILTKFHDNEELKSIYSETVGKLVVHDKQNESGLTETLSTYLDCNTSLTETAKKLFVHVNTIKYRLQKIEELTGCNIHHSEELLWLHTGLKIQKVLFDKSGRLRSKMRLS